MDIRRGTQGQNRITMRQVAQRAGVTVATVSHVINGTARISPETTARVKEAIREFHYVPNMTAKSLRSRKSRQVGFLIPNLNNSFYSRIASTFIEQASENGYVVQILGYEYSVAKELQAIDSLVSNSVDIVIILNGYGDEEGIQRLLDAGKTVILGDRVSDMEGVNCVYFDNRKAVSQAIALLKQKGYRNIGFLSEPLALTNVQERFTAYKNALSEIGYEYREENVLICEGFRLNAMTNGYQYIKELLSKKAGRQLPDAFIATSDLLAIGAVKAFRECGYAVPGDVGIVSYDNLDISAFVDPELTTIEQNQVMMGTELFGLVKQISENGKGGNVVLSQELIVRGSC